MGQFVQVSAMSKPAVEPVMIDDLDREIRQGRRYLRFSAAVEKLFLEEYLDSRRRMVPLWAFLGTTMYLAALMSDVSMVPDMASVIVALRLGVFVPFAVMVVLIMRYRATPATYDLLALGVGLLGISLPMGTLVFSASEYLFVYQTGSVGTLAFFVIVLRPRFLTVLLGLVAMIGVQIATIALNGGFDSVTFSGIVTFYVTLGVFLALSAYFTESVDRHNFLIRLRSAALQRELRKLSETDPMTGLNNRHVLDRFRADLWSVSAVPRIVSAIMLDIDNFKLYNDLYGHLKGDACIREVSRVVRQAVGADGTVFRYGGEEILAILPDMDRHRALALADTIRERIEALAIPHSGSGRGVVTASLGAATTRTDLHSPEDMILQSDSALYEAKRAGRNKVCAWGGGMDYPRAIGR